MTDETFPLPKVPGEPAERGALAALHAPAGSGEADAEAEGWKPVARSRTEVREYLQDLQAESLAAQGRDRHPEALVRTTVAALDRLREDGLAVRDEETPEAAPGTRRWWARHGLPPSDPEGGEAWLPTRQGFLAWRRVRKAARQRTARVYANHGLTPPGPG